MLRGLNALEQLFKIAMPTKYVDQMEVAQHAHQDNYQIHRRLLVWDKQFKAVMPNKYVVQMEVAEHAHLEHHQMHRRLLVLDQLPLLQIQIQTHNVVMVSYQVVNVTNVWLVKNQMPKRLLASEKRKII